jgi:hypothetical protein
MNTDDPVRICQSVPEAVHALHCQENRIAGRTGGGGMAAVFKALDVKIG